MRSFICSAALSLAVLVTSACSSRAPHDGPTGELAIDVAPLDLAELDDACFGLTVHAGQAGAITPASTPVWSKDGVCADRFGDGRSSIAYVGTCDAGPSGTQVNTVSLVIERLCGGDSCGASGASELDFVNPCPAGDPCRLEVACVENQDARVAFDVTVLRSAGQGFFDVGVQLEDVYCSAKLDCERDGGGALELLHDPATGERGATTVVGFACTGGPGATTVLSWQDFHVVCDDDAGHTYDYGFDPSGRGNLDPTFAGLPRVIFQAASYVGREDLEGPGGVPLGKGYWNVAIGFDAALVASLGLDCRLDLVGAVSESRLPGAVVPEGQVYPVIRWSEDLYVDGARVCTQSPLNGGGGVATDYHRPGDATLVLPRCYEVASNTFCDLDIDGVCEPGDEGTIDCDDLCAAGEGGSGDCDGACDKPEAGSVDCDGACEPGDALGSADCDTICAASDVAGSVDCDGACGDLDALPGPDCDPLLTCADQVQNHGEAGVDCGDAAGFCAPCGACSALAFDGDDWVMMQSGTTGQAIGSPAGWTAEGWVRLDAAPSGAPDAELGGIIIPTCQFWGVMVDAQRRLVMSRWPAGCDGTTQLEIGRWYHFAMTASRANGTPYALYLDGQLECAGTGAADIPGVMDNEWIIMGSRANACLAEGHTPGPDIWYLEGALKDIRVSEGIRYGGAFTPPSGPLAADANARLLYGMNEGQGTTLHDAAAPAHDANIFGATWESDGPFCGP